MRADVDGIEVVHDDGALVFNIFEGNRFACSSNSEDTADSGGVVGAKSPVIEVQSEFTFVYRVLYSERRRGCATHKASERGPGMHCLGAVGHFAIVTAPVESCIAGVSVGNEPAKGVKLAGCRDVNRTCYIFDGQIGIGSNRCKRSHLAFTGIRI